MEDNERPPQPTQGKFTVPSSKPSSKAPRACKKIRQSAAVAVAPAPAVQRNSLVDLATPISSISAFCQAVLSKIIPNEFWGRGYVQEHNKQCFLKNVHRFLLLRRFESMCLHEVMQGMKARTLPSPPLSRGIGQTY